ncbi:MAG: hypothetical protein N3F03_00800 [Ignavibacteria bacterium]|nr:hypothetical protein [Ignavibacteria bacterium]
MRLRLDSQHRLRYKSTAFKVFHFIGKSLLFVFILFLIFVGFTQTSYFRNILKNKIVELAEENLNGKLRIESIYGTLFSSLTIKNINYSIDGVEFVSAKTIHVSVNPISLIQNKIVVNKIFLENLHFNFIRFKDGKWITDKILKHPIEKDTTPSEKFNYDVIIKSIILSDCQLQLKKNVDSTDYSKFNLYDTFNYDDLIISNLNLNLKSHLNFPQNEFELKIKELNFDTNVKDFSLKKFELDFLASNKTFKLNNLEVKTSKSDLKIILSIDDFDLSDSQLFEKFPEKNLKLRIQSNPFDFHDLYSFLPTVNFLNGKVFVQAEASGSLKSLDVEYITAKYDSTKLTVQGSLKNINDPSQLYIKARVVNSELLMKDVSKLLPLYDIPKFETLGSLNLNINYEGSPLNFKTDFKIISTSGEVIGSTRFNFNRKVPNYFVDISTKNLKLYPFLKFDGNLNSKLNIIGEGFSPETINTDLNFFASNSSIVGNKIDTVVLIAEGKRHNFKINLFTNSENSTLNLVSSLDLKNKELPSYSLVIDAQNFIPEKFLFTKDFEGNLNIHGELKGQSLNLDEMDAVLNFSIFESLINNFTIDKSNLSLSINHSNNGIKSIRFRSDFLDLDLNGNYKFSDVLKVLPEQINLVRSEIDAKIKLFNHGEDTLKVIATSEKTKVSKEIEKHSKIDNPNFEIDYKINFKEFDLVNVFLKNLKLNVDGNISGRISNNQKEFIFENSAAIDDFWMVDVEKSTRIRNFNFNVKLNTTNVNTTTPNFRVSTSLETEKIIAASKLEDLKINIDFEKDTFKYKIQSVIDSLISVRSEGTFDISTPIFKASIDKATITYKKYKLTNQGALIFAFSKDKVEFEQFVLRRKKELFRISGELGYWGNQNLKFNVDRLELYDLILNFFPNITEEVGGELSIEFNLNGVAESPKIFGSFDLKNLSIGEDQLGEFSGKIDYKNEIINFNASYSDSVYKGNDFELNGYLPINLSFKDIKDRLKRDEPINISLTLSDFNLQPLRAIIPYFKNIEGSLNGNLSIVGTFNKPNFIGTITSKNMNFLLAQNNLKYSSDLRLTLKENKVILEKLELANLNTRKRGRLFTSAELEIDNIGIKNLKVVTNGSLLVLGSESRAVSPKVYGDLFFETSSPIVIEGSYNDYVITGDINIKESSLILPPIQTEYSSEEEMFVYKYVDYSPQINPADIAFLQAEKELRGQKKIKPQSSSNVLSKIRGRVKISLKNNVSLVLVFNQELNQRLFADLKGEVIYNFSEEQTSTQGEIELTQDSYLVFYQRFSASGKIRFESELSNPYLDVTATYSNYYIVGDTVKQQLRDVLIKLHLVGRVTELGKNLVNNRENIEVFIDGNVDKSKDASDVVAFILLGKFKDDLTAEDKTGALSNWGGTFQSAASSLLGSVVTNFANSILGDVLRNVEFKKVGEETRFSFEGRVKDVRFKVGGGTDVFQNFALANIQIEYPVSEKLFLRLVRKPSQMQVSKSTEMINEVGLKYKVEF